MMSPELIGIVAVGVALAGLFWRMFHSLDVRLNDLRDDLNGGLSGLRDQLNGRMDELKADLYGRMDELKSDLNRRMDEFKADVNGRMDELNTKVDALGRDHHELRERTGRIEVWLEVLLGRHRSSEETVPINRPADPPPRTPPRE